MKIDIQPMILMNNQSSPAKQPSDSIAPFTGEGNYYWQHQNQLQQSALTFDAMINPAEIKLAPDNKVINEVLASPIKIDASTPISSLCVKMEKNKIESINLPTLTIDQLITHIQTHLEQTGCILRDTIVNVDYNKTMLNRAFVANPTTTTTFKQYQLFADDNQQVELTLNIVNLSKPQLNQLQKIIQQYLAQKGYSLKQLMINGVKQ